MQQQTTRIRSGRHELAAVGLVLCLLTLCDAAPNAQLAAPGPGGVVMGHLHLATTDMEASRRFWTALGGVAVQNGQLQLIQLPGTFVMLRQSQQTTGGTEGSRVERVVLRVNATEVIKAGFEPSKQAGWFKVRGIEEAVRFVHWTLQAHDARASAA